MRQRIELSDDEVSEAVREWLLARGHVVPGDRVEVALRTNGQAAPPDPPHAAPETVRVWAEATVDPGRTRPPRDPAAEVCPICDARHPPGQEHWQRREG